MEILNATWFELNEIIEGKEAEWNNTLSSFSNIKNVPELIKDSYGDFFVAGPCLVDDDELIVEYKARKFKKLTAWLKLQANEYNTRAELSSGENGPSTENVVRFNDTPESSGDFIGNDHTTNITLSNNKTSYGDYDKISHYADYSHRLVEEFRKTFLSVGLI